MLVGKHGHITPVKDVIEVARVAWNLLVLRPHDETVVMA
jgi:hypothetical protein